MYKTPIDKAVKVCRLKESIPASPKEHAAVNCNT